MRKSLPLLAILFVTILYSCKKEKFAKTTNITNLQAATMVATSLSLNANGLVAVKNDIVTYAKAIVNNGIGCGVIDSFAVARQETATSNINYNYALGYYYTVNCVGNVQNNLTSTIISNGSFDAGNLSALGKITTTTNLSSLTGTASTYTMQGNYQLSGTFQTIDETQLSGNNNIAINIASLVLNKSSRNIVSGTAAVSVSGMVKNKNTFSYNGSVQFNNNGTATLSLEGTSYTVNLTTADLTIL